MKYWSCFHLSFYNHRFAFHSLYTQFSPKKYGMKDFRKFVKSAYLLPYISKREIQFYSITSSNNSNTVCVFIIWEILLLLLFIWILFGCVHVLCMLFTWKRIFILLMQKFNCIKSYLTICILTKYCSLFYFLFRHSIIQFYFSFSFMLFPSSVSCFAFDAFNILLLFHIFFDVCLLYFLCTWRVIRKLYRTVANFDFFFILYFRLKLAL